MTIITSGEFFAILALLNGMIGGTILVLPLLSIKTGYLLIPVLALFYGTFSGYCAYLLALHLGSSRSLRAAILEHFGGRKKYSIIYSIALFVSNFAVVLMYFQLLIKQVEGFIHPSKWIGIISFVFVIILTLLMRKFKVGHKLLSYGIISIVAYLIFLIWAQITAPSG